MALARSAVIRLAASRIGSPGEHTSGGVRISVSTGRWTGSAGGTRSPPPVRPPTIERAMNRRKSGRASSGPMTSAGMR